MAGARNISNQNYTTRPFRGQGKTPAMQSPVKTKTPLANGKRKFACSGCEITYIMYDSGPGVCPLCAAKEQVLDMERALKEKQNIIDQAMSESQRLRGQVDVVEEMKQACQHTSQEDIAFVKSVLYRWRDDKGSISLAALPEGTGRYIGGTEPPRIIGFVARPRKSEAEVHRCSSMGGIILASAFNEATKMVGGAEATKLLLKAVSWFMAAEWQDS